MSTALRLWRRLRVKLKCVQRSSRVKGGRRVRLTTLSPSVNLLSRNCECLYYSKLCGIPWNSLKFPKQHFSKLFENIYRYLFRSTYILINRENFWLSSNEIQQWIVSLWMDILVIWDIDYYSAWFVSVWPKIPIIFPTDFVQYNILTSNHLPLLSSVLLTFMSYSRDHLWVIPICSFYFQDIFHSLSGLLVRVSGC
jgi:hypothetical protein